MKRYLSILLTFALLACIASGCGQSEVETSQLPSQSQSAEPAQESPNPQSDPSEDPVQTEDEPLDSSEPDGLNEQAGSIQYPLNKPGAELTAWTSFPGNLSNYLSTYADQIVVQEAEKRTGVKIVFTEVSQQAERELFNLMIVSEDYCDMIFGLNRAYTGGATKAYEDGVIISLNDVAAQYAPDYYNELESSDLRMKQSVNDDGDMLQVNGYYKDDYSPNTSGLLIREDWLDELNMEKPVTYDQWYDALTAFKTEYDCDTALFLPSGTQSNNGGFVGGYGTAGFQVGARDVGGHFYQADGIVTSALIEDSYFDYLTLIHQWYSEGLINQEFYLVASGGGSTEADGIVMNNQTGIFSGKVDYITKYETADVTGKTKISGLAEPVVNEGDIFGFGTMANSSSSISISTQCDDVELALNWLNYWYTQDGLLLANYGIEGTTFVFGGDGQPQYTDLLTNNESGLQFSETNRIYLFNIPTTISDASRDFSTYSAPELEALNLWEQNSQPLYTLPQTTFDTDESTEYALLITDIETYASQEVLKFIIGERDLSTWDGFKADVLSMNLERCIEIQQNALDRYNNR